MRPVNTYSIVARDPETGDLGVAVQSHYFCVGGIVTWAEPGVGAVATQSFAEVSYGPLGLALMRGGKSASAALAGLLVGDALADRRQVAMIDAQGDVAAHTGARCIPGAGHRTGENYSAQANLMLRDTVWGAMGEAFEGAKGDLAERLMIALEAAEEEGGDIRGKQSAALLVVPGDHKAPWSDRIDIRVDDHPTPLPELRRLLSISRAYSRSDRAEALLMSARGDDIEHAMSEYDKALELMPDHDANPELLFWYATTLVSTGRTSDALPIFARVFAIDPNWRELLPRLVPIGLFSTDEETLARITSLGR